MAVSYDKLWELLVEKKMNRTELKEASGISFNVLARMGKNEPISLESMEKICCTLNCDIGDIVEIQKGEQEVDYNRIVCRSRWTGLGFRESRIRNDRAY